MRLALSRSGRGLVLFLSASSYTAWFSGVGERIGAEDFPGTTPPSILAAAVHLPHDIGSIIARDPFASARPAPTRAEPSQKSFADDVSIADATKLASLRNSAADVAAPQRQLAVPDIADAALPTALPGFTVRGTIAGRTPVAYVQNGSAMEIVRIGDRLDSRRVANIGLRGIVFDDGTTLEISGTGASRPAPAHATASSLLLQLVGLRRVLRTLAGRADTPSGTSPTAVPSPAASSVYPTPAPLATPDTRGLAPGANPSSDPNAPTAYPYPYPYAPHR